MEYVSKRGYVGQHVLHLLLAKVVLIPPRSLALKNIAARSVVPPQRRRSLRSALAVPLERVGAAGRCDWMRWGVCEASSGNGGALNRLFMLKSQIVAEDILASINSIDK